MEGLAPWTLNTYLNEVLSHIFEKVLTAADREHIDRAWAGARRLTKHHWQYTVDYYNNLPNHVKEREEKTLIEWSEFVIKQSPEFIHAKRRFMHEQQTRKASIAAPVPIAALELAVFTPVIKDA